MVAYFFKYATLTYARKSVHDQLPERDMKFSQGICGDGVAIFEDGLPLTPEQIIAKLNRFESFSEEMMRHRDELARLSAEFLKLDAFEDAAKCAIKADGIKYVIGRMPKS